MATIRKHSSVLLSAVILGFGGFASYAIFAHAQTLTLPGQPTDEAVAASGITFPVAELGNCGSKDTCRTYCNDPAHMDACIAFARDHGLMNQEEAERATSFKRKLAEGSGPGGCTTPSECETFCRDIANINTCIAFAEQHGLKDRHVEESKKIQAYLQSGGKMPGGCTNQQTCEVYCGDFSHAEECFNFAKRAGIGQGGPDERGDALGEDRFRRGPPPEQFQKFLELAKNGETPGGCASKDACERYCQEPGRRDECVAFGVKAGFIKPEEVERIKSIGVQGGPGGCNSPESCGAYCNDPVNQEACFTFAEEHGLIPPEELKRAKEGFVRLREGLSHAPPEVAACLKSVLGPTVLDDIQAGKLVPGPEIGDRVRGCFEKFGQRGDPGEVFQKAPPQVLACLEEKLGDDFEQVRSGAVQPTPEMADTFRVCFEQVRLIGPPVEGVLRGEGGPGGASPRGMQDFLRTAPPGIAKCLREKLGERFDKLQSGELQPGPELVETMRSCFQEFRPDEHRFEGERGEGVPGGFGIGALRAPFDNLPPQVLECVRSLVSEEVLEKAKSGGQLPAEFDEKMRVCFEKFRGASGAELLRLPGAPQPGPVGIEPRPAPGFTAAIPPVVAECLKAVVGSEVVEQVQRGLKPATDVSEQLRACYQRLQGEPTTMVRPLPTTDQLQPVGGSFRPGPGGCLSPEACQRYCVEHGDECRAFYSGGAPKPVVPTVPTAEPAPYQTPSQLAPPPTDTFKPGPGGCATPAACSEYCLTHEVECRSFYSGGVRPPLPPQSVLPPAGLFGNLLFLLQHALGL